MVETSILTLLKLNWFKALENAELIEYTLVDYNVGSTSKQQLFVIPDDEIWILHRIGLRATKETAATWSKFYVKLYRRTGYGETDTGACTTLITSSNPNTDEMHVYPNRDVNTTPSSLYLNSYPLMLMPQERLVCYAEVTGGNLLLYAVHLVYQRIKLDKTKVMF